MYICNYNIPHEVIVGSHYIHNVQSVEGEHRVEESVTYILDSFSSHSLSFGEVEQIFVDKGRC